MTHEAARHLCVETCLAPQAVCLGKFQVLVNVQSVAQPSDVLTETAKTLQKAEQRARKQQVLHLYFLEV